MANATKDDSNPRYTPGQSRSRPLEVLAVGLPRTGTRSIATALEMLGYGHCAHGFDMMDSPEYAAAIEKAVDANFLGKGPKYTRKDWDELLGHCGAVADAPLALWWRELSEAYPEAKVVLVQRDEDKWYKSLNEAVIESLFTPSGQFTRKYVEPLLGSRLGETTIKIMTGWLGANDEKGMKANARPAYRRHYEEIRAAIPPERLLNYELGSGWEPLCSFLGIEAKPAEKFPWVNESAAILEKIEEFKAAKQVELQTLMLRRVLPAVGVIAAALFAWRVAS